MTVQQLIALLLGALQTIELTLVSVCFGLILGLILALGRISKFPPFKGLSWVYIWIFRGTPLFLQILVIYYALPLIEFTSGPEPFKIVLDKFPSAIIALSLNSGAYLAEIIRAAIQSIDKGQMEAAKALGMSYRQAMFKVIIPQSYRRLIPPVGNEIIMLLKDSSLVSVIGMTELLRTARVMANSSNDAIFYLIAAIIYLMFTTIFTLIFQKLEKKYSAFE